MESVVWKNEQICFKHFYKRKNDFLKGSVRAEGLDSQISAGQVQVVLSGIQSGCAALVW